MARFFILLCCALFIFTSPLFSDNKIELVESFPVNTSLDLPQFRNTLDVWLEMLNEAKETIDIETFYFSAKKGGPLDDVLEAIINAAHRGVKVRIISEKKFHNTYPEPLNSLDKIENIKVAIIDFGQVAGGVMHAKYFMIDDSQIFLGSQNFDWRSLSHIHELGIRVKSTLLVEQFKKVFDADWLLANNNSDKKNLFNLHKTNIPIELELPDRTVPIYPVYSPKGFIPDENLWDEPRIIQLMDEAKKTINIQLLSYSPTSYNGEYYANLDNALRRAAARGVLVRMIISDWAKRKPGIDYLKSLTIVPNIDIKLSTIPPIKKHIPYGRVDHCKYLLVDDKKFWIGTSNWSKSYFYNDRNIGLIIMYAKLAQKTALFFNNNWQSEYTYLLDPCTEYEPPHIGEK